jgi:dTDP-4-amino-4,6-dideoxygalactose transaminase
MSDFVPRIRIPLYETQQENVAEAIRKGQLAQGPHLDQLATSLSEMFGMKYVVLTSNGFSALFAVLKSLDFGGSQVLTIPASTCFAFINAIKAAGYRPAFVDMDLESASIVNIESSLWGEHESIALVPDHFGRIAPFCKKARSDQGLIIEDAAQSFLSRRAVSTESDVLTLSFYPTKIFNGINGGAILTNCHDIYSRVKNTVSYVDQFNAEDAPRYNMEMNNINAAFALGTLNHIDEIQTDLLNKFNILKDLCKQFDIKFMTPKDGEIPSRFIVLSENIQHRNLLLSRFKSAKIEAVQELMWLTSKAGRNHFPNTRRIVELSFSVPFHPLISISELESIALILKR